MLQSLHNTIITYLLFQLLTACFYSAWAQYSDGPTPPRINIPGAIPLGPKQGNFRQGRVLQGPPPGAIRVRRPGQIRAGAFKSVPANAPYLQSLEEPQKPVTEEAEDLPQTTAQPFLSSIGTYAPTTQEQEVSQFLNSYSPTIKPYTPVASPVSPQPQIKYPEPARTPQPIRQPVQSATPIRFEAPARPQPVRLAPLSYRPQRPQFRPESKPQLDEEEEVEQPIRQQVYRPQPTRQPVQQAQPARPHQRERKPVAQVIRKYRDDNPDGSITWGFENDDGSFKEETIGIDCVTRGRYGYVDPDGLKREYNYETGILCDKTKEEPETKSFIDYQGNKAVLPNGVVLDLAAMGKKSHRKPQQYRN